MMSNSSAWAQASSHARYRVRLGTWTDWSRGGAVLGATLTLKREHGSLLIAFTAFFVSVVSTSFWRIARLVLHRLNSTRAPRDALYHQHQVLLRNSVTPASSLWALSLLGWAWRRDGRDGLLRMLPSMASAVICICIFTTAGGFSSQLSTGIGNAVLLDSSRCGYPASMNRLANVDRDVTFNLLSYYTQHLADSANYAQQCYSAERSGMFDCAFFVKDRLPTTVNGQAPCPFESSLCRSNTSNLLLDTGLLDSQHLGLNSPPDERFLFRLVLHCAPLVTEGYSLGFLSPSHAVTEYYYGYSGPIEVPRQVPDNLTLRVESQFDQYNRQPESVSEMTRSARFALR
ncbi:hypothetical protein CDD83_4464 [Cordyceps sp. RAO-2017]|nr:hypothetical protein CDD83_4464 [Cordyceps sp. RAO-2017]